MDAEERTAKAITITCTILRWVLDDSKAMIMFADSTLLAEDVQDAVYDILDYLEKTAPDNAKETEEQ